MDILQHIKSRGMTVSAVARLSGVSRPTIYELADPKHKPSLETVVNVCRVVGIHPSEIRPELGK
jgi:DNA-binding phage protein